MKEHGLAEVQKQREYQMDKQGGITRDNFTEKREREYVISVSEEKSKPRNLNRQNREELHPAQSTQTSKNINIIYCPYFPIPVLPQICMCLSSPFVFAGKHNLILE